jgi:hypothetical protein
MYLPLSTLELDHDSLREILSPCSTIVRDGGYSPPPTRSWQMDSSTPSKEFFMRNFLFTRQPRLSSCRDTLPMDSYSQNKLASHLFSQLHIRNMLSSLIEIVFSTRFLVDLPMSPKLLPFFPSLAILCGSESPTHRQASNPYRWVPYPISSLNLEESFQITSLNVNSFLGHRTIEQLHLVRTGLVRVI